ncbi:5-deoxyglucuronate isomerase [Natranaerovirga pectinivora]|uniref:5-deoxyglucuronate isomerase n=1 Tax=Natranaerovirga pectinivora TaxID=682400 RepID=A0A4R3MN61_9FIRM|nr:5-deoxy-glucuronate isomerase [Natranaerovirga pectinivora]TCT15464.1 5-deoxyglucuronate isomerase [Natranaerovirga pectinivora]
MKHFYKSEKVYGYNEVVDNTSELDLLRFGTILLKKDEKIELESGEYEIGLVIFSGKCTIYCDDQKFMNLGNRKDVFSGKPTTVYVPRDSNYSVIATDEGELEIGVCKVKADKKYAPFVIKADDVETVHRGKLNWQRDVNDIITTKYENRVDKIVLGETYGCAGQWSSYPSHKHDQDNMPYEVNMEEIYHFKVNPPQGFGVQVMYNDDLSLDECYTIRSGDSIAIKEGYHPVASAPGYQIYYLWVMAGNSGRVLTPNDDPNHAWVKAVESMVN